MIRVYVAGNASERSIPQISTYCVVISGERESSGATHSNATREPGSTARLTLGLGFRGDGGGGHGCEW